MKKIQHCYCIDLDSKRPEVLEFSGDELAGDLEFFGVNSPLELNKIDHDRRVFLNESDAEEYLQDFLRVSKNLKNSVLCKDKTLPHMIYRRRYIVQALRGEKLYTVRHYKKPWQNGQLFNFHDQTYTLTVRLKKITELENDGLKEYRYDFELP